jgi:hypothetical protein
MKNDQNSNLKFDRKGVAFKVAQPPTSVSPGVHILACLETNTVLNGWWSLTQSITKKYKRAKQRTANIVLAIKF